MGMSKADSGGSGKAPGPTAPPWRNGERGQVAMASRPGESREGGGRPWTQMGASGEAPWLGSLEAGLAGVPGGGDLLRLQIAALESAANGIVITDLRANVVWSNSAFTELTGYLASEIVGTPVSSDPRRRRSPPTRLTSSRSPVQTVRRGRCRDSRGARPHSPLRRSFGTR